MFIITVKMAVTHKELDDLAHPDLRDGEMGDLRAEYQIAIVEQGENLENIYEDTFFNVIYYPPPTAVSDKAD